MILRKETETNVLKELGREIVYNIRMNDTP